jgi:hypothetical protein
MRRLIWFGLGIVGAAALLGKLARLHAARRSEDRVAVARWEDEGGPARRGDID